MGKWGTSFDIARDIIVPFRKYLDVYEKEVLFFIYCRTRMFNKEWERISLNQFMRGYFSDKYQIDGVSMSENKFLECLKHLKAKGIVEMRSTGLTTGNEYRIKEESEVSASHIETYVRRHQPKVFARFLSRVQRIPNVRKELGNVHKSVFQLIQETTLGNEARLPSETREGVPSETMVLNNTNKEQPISIPSPKAATRGLRKISLQKGK